MLPKTASICQIVLQKLHPFFVDVLGCLLRDQYQMQGIWLIDLPLLHSYQQLLLRLVQDVVLLELYDSFVPGGR